MTRRYNHVAMEFSVIGIFHYLALTIYDICFRGRSPEFLRTSRSAARSSSPATTPATSTPIIGLLVPRQMAFFFARKTLWKPGVASWWLDGVGTIPVDRDGGSDVTAIRRVLQTLNSGKALILFPEGTRSPDGHLQAAKPGVGLIACKTQAPVLPVRIFNSHEAFGRKGGLRLGTRVSVTFGPVLPPAVYDPPGAGRDRYQKTSERIMLAISQLSEARPPVI